MSLRRIRELLGVPPAGRLPQHDALLALLEENVPLRETISMRMLRKMLATTTFEYHLRDVGYPLGDDAYRTMTALTSATLAPYLTGLTAHDREPVLAAHEAFLRVLIADARDLPSSSPASSSSSSSSPSLPSTSSSNVAVESVGAAAAGPALAMPPLSMPA